MTEYYSNREHFERPLPVATFNNEMSEFLTDIIEATKIIKDEQVDHLYVQIGTAELGLEKSYTTFEESSNRSVDMQTSAQKAHKDIMETIDSKFTLGMDETFNNLNDVNGQNKQYKTQKLTYTKAYEGPGAGGSTYEEHYTLSQLLNYKTSPIKAAREVYNGHLNFVKERIKNQDQMTAEEIKSIEGKSAEELVELYFPSQIPEYNRLKATNWQENNKEWLGYVETGFKWAAAIVTIVGSGGWGAAAATYIIADGTHSALTGKTMISGTRLTSEEQKWAMIETVANVGGAGMGKLGRIFEGRKMTKLAAVANVASKSDEAADAAHVMYDVVTKDQNEAMGSVAQYALLKSVGAAVKGIRKSSISSADDVSLKTNLDNDVVDLSSSKSNNLTLKTGSDLSIPKTQNHLDVPSSAKSHVDVSTSGVADAELTKVKHTADLNLSTKSSVNVPTSKTADIDLSTVKSNAEMNLSSKTVSNAATVAAVGGVKPSDVDLPKVKQIRDDYNDYVAHKTSVGEEPLSMSDWKLKVNNLKQNQTVGKEFKVAQTENFKQIASHVENRITIATIIDGQIKKVQVDAIGFDSNGKIRIQDYTASSNISSKRQAILDNISQNGGVIVGKGKGEFVGGVEIPKGTRIDVISSSNQKIENFKMELEKLKRPYISRKIIDGLISTENGERLDPSRYISHQEIETHLNMFKDGVVKVISKEGFNKSVMKFDGNIGPEEGHYVMPKFIYDKAVLASDGNPRVLEELLGFDRGYLGDSPLTINVKNPKNLRMPSGNEPGAWQGLWEPGGFTKGGIPEAVVDQFKPGDYTIGKVFE